MRRRLTTALVTALAIVLLAAAGLLLVIHTGAYNVAATEPHWGLTRWAFNTLQKNSVAARADDVPAPPPTDSAALAHGFIHFQAMCVMCHGAPGVERGELGQGIRPRPPRLEDAASRWTDRELFWITKHGIRVAGMPAFGPTHDDGEIWSIVAAVRRIEDMTPEEYARQVSSDEDAHAADRAGGDEGHAHGPGTPDHPH